MSYIYTKDAVKIVGQPDPTKKEKEKEQSEKKQWWESMRRGDDGIACNNRNPDCIHIPEIYIRTFVPQWKAYRYNHER